MPRVLALINMSTTWADLLPFLFFNSGEGGEEKKDIDSVCPFLLSNPYKILLTLIHKARQKKNKAKKEK